MARTWNVDKRQQQSERMRQIWAVRRKHARLAKAAITRRTKRDQKAYEAAQQAAGATNGDGPTSDPTAHAAPVTATLVKAEEVRVLRLTLQTPDGVRVIDYPFAT